MVLHIASCMHVCNLGSLYAAYTQEPPLVFCNTVISMCLRAVDCCIMIMSTWFLAWKESNNPPNLNNNNITPKDATLKRLYETFRQQYISCWSNLDDFTNYKMCTMQLHQLHKRAVIVKYLAFSKGIKTWLRHLESCKCCRLNIYTYRVVLIRYQTDTMRWRSFKVPSLCHHWRELWSCP